MVPRKPKDKDICIVFLPTNHIGNPHTNNRLVISLPSICRDAGIGTVARSDKNATIPRGGYQGRGPVLIVAAKNSFDLPDTAFAVFYGDLDIEKS